jgi:hypothetical protein
MGSENNDELWGGVLYGTSPRYNTKPFSFRDLFSIEITVDEPLTPKQEDFYSRLKDPAYMNYTVDLEADPKQISRLCRKIRRKFRKLKQQTKRRWQKSGRKPRPDFLSTCLNIRSDT